MIIKVPIISRVPVEKYFGVPRLARVLVHWLQGLYGVHVVHCVHGVQEVYGGPEPEILESIIERNSRVSFFGVLTFV